MAPRLSIANASVLCHHCSTPKPPFHKVTFTHHNSQQCVFSGLDRTGSADPRRVDRRLIRVHGRHWRHSAAAPYASSGKRALPSTAHLGMESAFVNFRPHLSLHQYCGFSGLCCGVIVWLWNRSHGPLRIPSSLARNSGE